MVENKLKMAHGAKMSAEKHMERALSLLEPPTSVINSLESELWLKPICRNNAETRSKTPALWSDTLNHDIMK
jgi:hypothetical protein